MRSYLTLVLKEAFAELTPEQTYEEQVTGFFVNQLLFMMT